MNESWVNELIVGITWANIIIRVVIVYQLILFFISNFFLGPRASRLNNYIIRIDSCFFVFKIVSHLRCLKSTCNTDWSNLLEFFLSTIQIHFTLFNIPSIFHFILGSNIMLTHRQVILSKIAIGKASKYQISGPLKLTRPLSTSIDIHDRNINQC